MIVIITKTRNDRSTVIIAVVTVVCGRPYDDDVDDDDDDELSHPFLYFQLVPPVEVVADRSHVPRLFLVSLVLVARSVMAILLLQRWCCCCCC